ncbi:glycerophosphodiester phosphodiesterase [Arthrobacter sp. Sa2BUA2]|uniref:Glycerophosphodiester phosphodiesterase n=1 Tax=Arthrobacter pullicola TaxID=2762224 RepID=A0ABR8YII6_9MICC|nr:glycerophosphodiester phosphodiesterase family protein [Arthrobacter pullicola]MBD8044017.1 glycerophosphodiester phosphodiesterase [Arthrobacter pullicola]
MNRPLPGPGEMLNIAHRGNSSQAPENTLAAFASAAAAGAAMIETDLQLSSDGTAVLIHDASLSRTAGSDALVGRTTAARLREADAGSWFAPEFAAERIPDLPDLIAFAAGHPEIAWLLEFKGEWSVSALASAAELLQAGGLSSRCLLQGFSRQTVRNLSEAAPDLARGLLIAAAPPPRQDAELLNFLADVDAAACNPHGAVLAAAPELVETLHSNGQAVYSWTLNQQDQWAAAVSAGVDGIITDHPAELAGWLRQAGPGRTVPGI